MGVTKTDFMRGMQCPRMLWLDKHHPELKVIPPEVKHVLTREMSSAIRQWECLDRLWKRQHTRQTGN